MATKITNETLNIPSELKAEIKNEVDKAMLETLNVSTKEEFDSVIEGLRNGVKSMDPKQVSKSKRDIQNLVGDVVLKVFSQDLFTNNIVKGESLLKYFNDGYLDFGNTKEYILEPLTGFTDFDPNAFIPTEITEIPVESCVISFYEADGKTLSANSKKWVKELTLIEKNLIQYFLSGKCFEFISKKIAAMAESLLIGQMAKILEFITTATPQKVIDLDSDTKFTPEGATNAAEAWVKIFNIINDMQQPSADYAYKAGSVVPRTASQSDLIIFGNVKVFQFLKNMKAFIFHSDLFQPIQDLTNENFFIVPRKYIVSDNKTPIKTSEDYYLDENTLYILDRNESIKIAYVLEEYAEQFFGKNLAIGRFKHLWFTWGILNWAKMCKITSTKLMVDVNQQA